MNTKHTHTVWTASAECAVKSKMQITLKINPVMSWIRSAYSVYLQVDLCSNEFNHLQKKNDFNKMIVLCLCWWWWSCYLSLFIVTKSHLNLLRWPLPIVRLPKHYLSIVSIIILFVLKLEKLLFNLDVLIVCCWCHWERWIRWKWICVCVWGGE